MWNPSITWMQNGIETGTCPYNLFSRYFSRPFLTTVLVSEAWIATQAVDVEHFHVPSYMEMAAMTTGDLVEGERV